MPPTLLIVDDEEAISWALQTAFQREGFRVRVAPSAEVAFQQARQARPDVIILDVRLPGMDGLAALQQLRQLSADAPVIVITAHGNLSTAVRAVEGGAFDYLAKPFDLEQIREAVGRALQKRDAPAGTEPAPPPAPAPGEDGEMIGSSLAMQAVFKRIALVAPHEASVLITGESGTGKELVARALHRHSARRGGPFLPVHIAALSENLVESELFGHVRGAFTGAAAGKPGLLTLAEGGTVFLDELADIPLAVQAKLLRVLERQEVLPVGGGVAQRINVRVLAATHQDLLQQVAAGRFRHDLYYRLNVFEVRLPALRDRLEDLPPLVEHFLRNELKDATSTVPPATLQYLRNRPWAGNVRELRNAVAHASIVGRGGPLLPDYFPPPASLHGPETLAARLAGLVREWVRERVSAAGGREPAHLYDALLECVQPPLIDEVLRQTQNNRLVSARWLGLARATLRKLIGPQQPPEGGHEEADSDA